MKGFRRLLPVAEPVIDLGQPTAVGVDVCVVLHGRTSWVHDCTAPIVRRRIDCVKSRFVSILKHFVIGHSARPVRLWARRQHGVAAIRQGNTHMTVLPNLAQENEALKAMIAEMQAKLANASAPKSLSMKVSDKGALSIYGLGRFPVTLYRGQMDRLLAHSDQIKAFMDANAALLAVKA